METTGIKLFGKKITCYDNPKFTVFTREELSNCCNDEHLEEDQISERKQEDGNPTFEDVEQDTEGDATNSQLKKPESILPCPRCKSMDTKFCYYNNYNVKQPRHFCKSCQRYWTAGGTMRTMPVGAGRRRNKNSTSQCRFETIISQEAFQVSQINEAHGVSPNLLSFGLDFAHVDNKDKENGDECSSGSTVTTSNAVTEKTQGTNGFHSWSYNPPGVSWSYNPWNSAAPIPSVYPSGYSPMPMPLNPSPYWNYIPNWLPISSPMQSDIPSSVLGKHSRQSELIKSSGSEEPKKKKNPVLIPKTLRMDDPNEVAKSSIWSTLGIQNENISTRGLFKAFQTKGDEVSTTSPVLQANPAALSRLLCFQERA